MRLIFFLLLLAGCREFQRYDTQKQKACFDSGGSFYADVSNYTTVCVWSKK